MSCLRLGDGAWRPEDPRLRPANNVLWSKPRGRFSDICNVVRTVEFWRAVYIIKDS
jgi:hypothetical protein